MIFFTHLRDSYFCHCCVYVHVDHNYDDDENGDDGEEKVMMIMVMLVVW